MKVKFKILLNVIALNLPSINTLSACNQLGGLYNVKELSGVFVFTKKESFFWAIYKV